MWVLVKGIVLKSWKYNLSAILLCCDMNAALDKTYRDSKWHRMSDQRLVSLLLYPKHKKLFLFLDNLQTVQTDGNWYLQQ